MFSNEGEISTVFNEHVNCVYWLTNNLQQDLIDENLISLTKTLLEIKLFCQISKSNFQANAKLLK